MWDLYKKSEIDLLDFDSQKRRKISDARQKLFYTMEHLQIMKDNKDSQYTIDKAIEDIKYAFEELEFELFMYLSVWNAKKDTANLLKNNK